METSIFTNKAETPDIQMLREIIGDLFDIWMEIRSYVFDAYPKAVEEWNFPGQKYGWSFRIKDKKRAIIYLLPGDGFFTVAFKFGKKATDDALKSDISQDIKDIISSATVYAEGRGFIIEVRNKDIVKHIKKLVDSKLSY